MSLSKFCWVSDSLPCSLPALFPLWVGSYFWSALFLNFLWKISNIFNIWEWRMFKHIWKYRELYDKPHMPITQLQQLLTHDQSYLICPPCPQTLDYFKVNPRRYIISSTSISVSICKRQGTLSNNTQNTVIIKNNFLILSPMP